MPFKVETDKYTVISSDPNGDIMTTLDTITQPVLQKTDSSGLSISLLNNFNNQIYRYFQRLEICTDQIYWYFLRLQKLYYYYKESKVKSFNLEKYQ